MREKFTSLLDKGATFARIFREAAADVFNEELVLEARRFIDEKQELLDGGIRWHDAARAQLFQQRT